MDALAELLGQNALADKLASRMASDRHVWLKGPPGSGKSTVAALLATRLARKGRVIRLAGDIAHGGTQFLAAHRALAGTRASRPVRDALPVAIISPIRGVPYAGATLAEWIRVVSLFAHRKRPEFLSSEQLDLLEGFQRAASGQPLFLIVDDVGWLDPETAQLIAIMFRPDLRQAFAFTETLSAVFVENSEAPRPSVGDPLAGLDDGSALRCEGARQVIFGQVLECFGLKRPPEPGLVADLHAISGGHLEIARQIAKADAGADLSSLLADGDRDALMSGLLDKRLRGIGRAAALTELLSIASRAGSAFSEAELRCAFADPDVFPLALESAYQEDMLVPEGANLRFVHDVVRAAAERLNPQSTALHAKMADCLRRLRPGDYAGRLRHLRLADEPLRTAEMALVVAARGLRGDADGAGAEWDGEVASFGPLLADLRRAYQLMDQGLSTAALSKILPHHDGTFSLLQGEVTALIALNLMKQRSADKYARAAALLESWQLRRDEPELWQRLMSILAAAWVNVGEVERAGRLYARLMAELETQSLHDPAAHERLQTLNRKADMFLPSEISQARIRRAAAWFGPSEDGGRPRSSFEYGACELNPSGALYTNGRFADAAEHAARAMTSIQLMRQDGLRTVDPFKALNNFAIASFRAGSRPAGDLADALHAFLPAELGPHPDDISLLACNWAALSMLSDRVEAAREVLEELWTQVHDVDVDAYFLLHAGANLAVARAATGERTQALGLFGQIEPAIETLPKWLRRAHLRRHAIMKGFLESCPPTPGAAALDAAPMQHRQPDGDQDPWWSIGRGLRMSDIQIWSEA